MKHILIFGLILFSVGCNREKTPIASVITSSNPNIKQVFDNLEKHEVQFIISEVKRETESNQVTFIEDSFQVEDSTYFYPASTVKFPIAIFALEKLALDSLMDRNTKFYVEGDSIETTIATEIEKIFAVSDNDAYNRLFEYLGQDYIAHRLKELEIPGQIIHRLSVEDSDNISTKPIIYYINDSTTRSTVPIISQAIQPLVLKSIVKGKGYYEDTNLIDEPKDFSLKNYLPVQSLHMLMKRLMFPDNYPEQLRFQLAADDREFLVSTMKILPRQAGYNPEEYYDAYGKFLIFGDTKSTIPATTEIYNKVGYAYGYLTDCAYIIDKTTQREFIITATVYVNKNQIFNDDQYEYDSVGIPFLAELGRILTRE